MAGGAWRYACWDHMPMLTEMQRQALRVAVKNAGVAIDGLKQMTGVNGTHVGRSHIATPETT